MPIRGSRARCSKRNSRPDVGPSNRNRCRIAVVLGTRPEAIKLAPVVRALRQREELETVVVSTGQHREMLAQVFDQFRLAPDVDLDLMLPGQSLNGPFIDLMKRCHLILTDSGGVQEEAPTLAKPLLLLRKLTERPEAFMAGAARIVGTRRESIVRETSRLLGDEAAYRAMANVANPYGDGRASWRIAEALCRWSRGSRVLLEGGRQFSPRLREVA